MKRKSRDLDSTLELSCHAGCPTDIDHGHGHGRLVVLWCNTTFNNISVILVEEIREKHQPATMGNLLLLKTRKKYVWNAQVGSAFKFLQYLSL
jgi:hypothetical protein